MPESRREQKRRKENRRHQKREANRTEEKGRHQKIDEKRREEERIDQEIHEKSGVRDERGEGRGGEERVKRRGK